MPDLTEPLDDTITAGQAGHPQLHSDIAAQLNWLFAHQQLPLSMQLAYEDIYVPDGVVPVAIRHDDNPPNTDWQAAQYLRDRHLVGGFALIADTFLAQNSSTLTLANALEMQSWGMEMMAHSRTHGPTKPLWDEVITPADDLRALNLQVSSWARPGPWTGTLDSFAAFDTRLGQAARRQYIALESYVAEGWGGKVKTFPVSTPYGGEYIADTALAGIQARYDQAADAGGSIEILFHTGGFGAVGSAAWLNYLAVLDWLVTERAAGRAMILTPTALQKAKRGPRRNLAPDPSFEIRGADPTGSPWGASGTVAASTTARTGTYSMALDANSSIGLSPGHAEALRSLEINAHARAEDANATARLVMTQKLGAATLFTRTIATAVTSAGWTAFRGTMGMDPRADRVEIQLAASGARVLVDDVAIYKT